MVASPELLNVELLENSYSEIRPRANEFAISFYQNLFSLYPETQPLFAHVDMAKQQQMLISALNLVVKNLRKPNLFKQTLKGLGSRHVRYGALPEYYPLLKEALLKTFQDYLQDRWTAETRQAWTEAFDAITKLMLDGY
ncbi:globin [Halothece sp. PCC 7418]|uniref:globin family protein n=1 Tax=Halothece sp. (strain PCC 7418) TaxID=65093 RepID=UPI0002A0806C|nr:globin family protein [Halothece sp. PCC 7418]AFZ44970.1 globin [Halothece sp. PCC 7418]